MGLNSKTGEQVILHANERTYHTIIFGLIGTGKSATILIPAMLQDMENMKCYLLSYRKYLMKVDEELEQEFFSTEFERKKKDVNCWSSGITMVMLQSLQMVFI